MITGILSAVGIIIGVFLGIFISKKYMAPRPAAAAANGRDDIAKQVIFYAGVGIVLVSIVVICAPLLVALVKGGSALDNTNFQDIAKTVFNTLIPMFGTWVGTVIAFYFARENYETAAKATKDLVGQLGDDRLKQIPVKDAWIAVNAISGLEYAPGSEAAVKFTDIEDLLTSQVSRVPAWTKDRVVHYVIHESMIYKYLAKAKKDDATFKDFLDYPDGAGKVSDVVSKIAFVGPQATLADAKAAMEKLPDCQDVFVTDTGKPDGKVLGWITNADIAKKSRA